VRVFLTKICLYFFFIFFSTRSIADSLDGCINSPENPTFILGMIGLTGAITPWTFSQLNRRRKRRENQKK